MKITVEIDGDPGIRFHGIQNGKADYHPVAGWARSWAGQFSTAGLRPWLEQRCRIRELQAHIRKLHEMRRRVQ